MKKTIITFFTILIILTSTNIIAQSAQKNTPLEIIKETTNKVLNILESQEYKKQGDEYLKKKVFEIADNIFSWEDISKRALGRRWLKLKKEQKIKYVKLFKKLVKNTYLKKFKENEKEVKDEVKEVKIDYLEEIIKGKYAEVRTKVRKKDQEEVLIYYRLTRKKNNWKIYDIIIEGVSLIKNYRSQFDDILRKKTFDDFLKKLEEKTAEFEKAKTKIEKKENNNKSQ